MAAGFTCPEMGTKQTANGADIVVFFQVGKGLRYRTAGELSKHTNSSRGARAGMQYSPFVEQDHITAFNTQLRLVLSGKKSECLLAEKTYMC